MHAHVRNATFVVFAGAAVAFLAAACGGNGSPSSTAAARGSAAASAVPSTSNLPAAAAQTTAPGQASVQTSAPAAGSAAGAPAASAAPSASRSAASAQQSALTKPGSYSYAVSGSSQSPFGNQNLSGTSTLTVDRPQGNEQHTSMSGKNGKQDLTIQARSSGYYLADIKLSSPGFGAEFKPASPQLYFPSQQAAGYAWHWSVHSTDGKYLLDVNATLGGSQDITVGGQSRPSTIISSVLHITGSSVDITVHQKDWVSRTYRLVLREHATSSGTAYGAKFTSDVTSTLRSTSPN